MYSATAPAKIILCGEHAVVYNEPAIAVPVSSLRAEATIQETGQSFQLIAHDFNDKKLTLQDDDPLIQAVRLTLSHLQQDVPDATLTVQSAIPPASGLGSGAAVSAAIVRALLSYFDATLPLDTINSIVYEIEKIHHGTPSGIDNTTVVYEKPVYFIRGQQPRTIETSSAIQLVIADTGQAALTRPTVEDVRHLYTNQPEQTRPVIQRIGELTRQAQSALKQADCQLLGQLMTENHQLLRHLTVSSSQLDGLVNVAVKNGAAGAKLSGGGRGGNMIALVTDNTIDKVMNALRQAGAVRVFSTAIQPEHVTD